MYTLFLGTTRRSLTAFVGSGYPQFRAKGAPFLRFAPEQPLRAAATIPGAFRTESIKNARKSSYEDFRAASLLLAIVTECEGYSHITL